MFAVRPRTMPMKSSTSGCCALVGQARPIPDSGASVTGRAITSRRECARATDIGMRARPDVRGDEVEGRGVVSRRERLAGEVGQHERIERLHGGVLGGDDDRDLR